MTERHALAVFFGFLAVVCAMDGRSGWGWFLFVALILA